LRVFRDEDRRLTVIKRLAALAIAGLVMNLACLPFVSAQEQLTREEKQARKIKKQVNKLERYASDDPVTVRLRDGDKVKGYISDVAEDYFVITNNKSSQPVVVHYSNVRDISVGMGSTTKIALAIGGGFLALFAICAVTHRCQE